MFIPFNDDFKPPEKDIIRFYLLIYLKILTTMNSKMYTTTKIIEHSFKNSIYFNFLNIFLIKFLK